MAGFQALASEATAPVVVASALVLLIMALYLRHASRRRLVPSFVDRVVSVATGRLMHHIVLPATTTVRPTTLVVVVPGNPGVPGFYEPLMRRVHALAGGAAEVVGLSHTGHSMPWLHANATFDLTTQIEDKVAYLDARLRADPHLQVVLVGHSIGAHVALGMLAAWPHRVRKVALLQPAVMHIAQSASGKKLAPLFAQYKLASWAAWPVELLPTAWVKALLPLFVGQNPVLQDAAYSLCNRHVLRNVLNMARHEMAELLDIDHGLVAAYQHKLSFVFSAKDAWVPTEFAAHLTHTYKEAQSTTVDLPHAFMIDPRGSDTMADLVWAWMKQDCPSAALGGS
ncbi:hypothetical protein ACHHYP_14677 [Achlya hypogyna]|uniref:Serine protease family S33 n=1 Tax=Achlya hypogyna TaxID=1202772 RepID=A0A1V9YCL9_ACHHY|nr:hypothetical protein ACHHYP_14677 [Achlya hypogyna]